MYGATAYGYSVDSDFITVGYSEKRWQGVIDEFYNKYDGIRRWHESLLNQVRRDGYIEIPSGRYYNYSPKRTHYGLKWPLTTIKNYPVQGFGAELVKLARVEFFRRFQESGLEGEFICTIHDSLVCDVPLENVKPVATMLKESIELTPQLCKQWFDYDFSLPIWCEIQVGQNKLDMKEIVW